MLRGIGRFTVLAVSGAVASWSLFACSDDEAKGGNAGTGGSAASGGAGGSGGSGATDGSSGTGGQPPGDAGDPYECQANLTANPRDPGGTGAEGSACCDGFGTCTTASSITGPAATSYGHDTCQASSGAADLRCVPTDDALADAATAGVFTVCQAKLGTTLTLEGRCLPKCFILGNPQAAQLSSEGCLGADAGAGEQVCAPCYNPIDGSPTGACTQKAGDAPTEPAPTPFQPCGADDAGGPAGGLCVPTDLATASNNPAAANLPQLECATGEVCAPTVKVRDLSACFEPCESAVSSLGAQYAAGACVPYYVVASNPDLSVGLSVLTQGSCATGELCAPCLNPLGGDAPTGACQ
jgi:hypothetical protein